MRSVAPITKILPQFLWSAKMPKIYAKCQKSMQKTWNFIFCHLNLVRAVYYLSFKLLVRSVAQITKIVPPFLWFRGGLCYKHRGIRHGDGELLLQTAITEWSLPLPYLLSFYQYFPGLVFHHDDRVHHTNTAATRRVSSVWEQGTLGSYAGP